jgi:hypothetical protein
MGEFPPPESYFGADARAIILNWLDSTYISQSCWSAGNFQIVPEISGRFSIRDTTIPFNPSLSITYRVFKFNNGITMGPVEIKEWYGRFGDEIYFYTWAPAYIEKYQVLGQFVALSASKYKDQSKHDFGLSFLRITPENQYHYLNLNRK